MNNYLCNNLDELRGLVEEHTKNLINGVDITVVFDDGFSECKTINGFNRVINKSLKKNGGEFKRYVFDKPNNYQVFAYLVNEKYAWLETP